MRFYSAKHLKHFSKYLSALVVAVMFVALAGTLAVHAPKGLDLAPATAHASGAALTGWAWSSNIGWVSFSGTAGTSTTYGVTVGSGGVLSGYAWGSGIGWINFGANSCGATPTLSNGSLSGFAQAINTGSDGCISLSGTASNSNAYGVTLSGTTFTGYAWASDTIGWLNFSGTAGDSTTYGVVYGGAGSPTCTLSATPNPAATGSSITLNYTTTNSPTTGVIKDASNNIITSAATSSSQGVSATAPSSAGNYTYTMKVSSPSGSGSCQNTLQTQVDVCTDIPGIQTSAPPSPCVTPVPSPGQCVPAGYTWSGSACVALTPSITTFSGPTRVRSGSTATLSYNVTNPPASCSITGTNGFSTNVSPTSGVQGFATTTPITSDTRFTLTCASTSSSILVGITPTFQEQ